MPWAFIPRMKATWLARIEIQVSEPCHGVSTRLAQTDQESHGHALEIVSIPAKACGLATHKDRDGTGKVVEHGERVVRSDEERETHEHPRENEGDPGDTALRALGEDARGVAVLGHAVERAGGDVVVRVCGGDGEDEDAVGSAAAPSTKTSTLWKRGDEERGDGNEPRHAALARTRH
jgi:hypothetical protein